VPAGIALLDHYTLRIALGGAIVIALYKIMLSPFTTGGDVALILSAAIVVNAAINARFNATSDAFPVLGAAGWVANLLTTALRQPIGKRLPGALEGSIFLFSLVLCASMMPVDQLPRGSWQSALGLGFLSAVFDNIPVTALALKQGGYDWGFLAYAVGFGGSMIWFGSSAGVALSNMYPQARSVGQWLRHGWHVAVGYVAGFFVMLPIIGFHPDSAGRCRIGACLVSRP
jgi:hypothetical protein